MNAFTIPLLQSVIILAVAPLATGLVRWFKARLQGRRGAAPWLTYVTLATLARKENVISPSRSWIFRAAPFVVFATMLFLSVTLPLLFSGKGASGIDFLVVAGVLTLNAIFLVFGGLDSATAFGGMGASREMTLTALMESVLLTGFATLALTAGSGNVETFLTTTSLWTHPTLLFTLGALVCVTLAENARYPVDNPATHLELTMVHEAMVLEYSGPYLALLEYAASIKLTIFLLLIVQLVLPVAKIGEALIGLLLLLALLALLESSIAKMRFFRMQEFATFAFFLAFSGLVLTVFL